MGGLTFPFVDDVLNATGTLLKLVYETCKITIAILMILSPI